MTEIESSIDGSRAFAGLSAAHIAALAAHGESVTIPAGNRVLTAGQPAQHAWLLVAGAVDVELHAPPRGTLLISRIEPGELLGVSWVAPPRRWHFDATAVVDSVAVRFDTEAMRAGFDDDPVFGLAIHDRVGAVLCERLQSARVQLLDLYGSSAKARPSVTGSDDG